MIDLHLHTTASDGRSTPDALVREAARAGLTTIAVTDHDTVGAIAAVRAAAAPAGITVVAGIEITAVEGGRDVHVLGYFIDEQDHALADFLLAQRRDRRRRVDEIVGRLAALGMPVTLDLPPVPSAGGPPADPVAGQRAVGRPLVAAALVEAGHARDISDAFDRFLSPGRPAFVARQGATPAVVIARIVATGGVASLAHPGKIGFDDQIPAWVAAGLAAIEVFHPDHPDADRARYEAIADEFGLLVTGGSDYHGPGSGRSDALGRVTLPPEDFARLVSAVDRMRTA